jgi:alginate O-acetyltransferase complex protein AlgI
MLFNSLEFLVFFPIVTALYFLLSYKFRWLLLLIASCVFYMFFIPQYILILLVTILIDYIAAIKIEKVEARWKKRYLIISIISTCLVLFIFKYYDFFNHNIHELCNLLGFHYNEKLADIILPIGLSFHTFQSLSYVIEVYKGKQKSEKHFGIYSLYVMFYPQLVTGPIERPQNLLVQLREKKMFLYENFVKGLRLILFGLFIKMVVADNLAVYVDQIYKNPDNHNSLSILIGLIFYSFQIYCDFYGYSSIAIGCALTMGYSLIDNFKNPYLAGSLNEFWHRWHISLSTWFRDYVYIPMGGRRVKVSRWVLNILIVFILSGLWHGPNWTFVLWGLAHGILILTETLINRILKISERISQNIFFKIFNVIKTFILVTLLWVLFRAKDLDEAGSIFNSLFSNFDIDDDFKVDIKIWIFFLLFMVFDVILYKRRFDSWCNQQVPVFRWSLYMIMIFIILVYSSVENFPFIYFQF